MSGLFLVASLFWLLPAVSHTLDIPLQSALLIRGEPVGFTTTSTHRQKRSETFNGTCKEDEYRPRKAKHCCNKCLAGFRVESHCSEEGMKSNCVPCETGFNKSPSSSTTCEACNQCLSPFGQVELQPCTTTSDIICGCRAGRYKSSNERKFKCLMCSTCENGRQLVACTADRDTLCICNHGFYHDSTAKCRSCKECNNTDDCKDHCPEESRKPEEPDVVPMILAGVLGAALLAVLIVVIVKNRQKIVSAVQTKRPLPVTDITGSSQLSTPLMESSTSTCKLDSLPGHEVYIVEGQVIQHQNKAQNSALPLPDITLQTTTPCLNSPGVLYKVIECIPVGSWREFIRRLGVSNHIIEICEHDYRHYKDAQYAMLSSWVHNAGSSGVTRDTLFRVLREMNLGGCVERIEESLCQF